MSAVELFNCAGGKSAPSFAITFHCTGAPSLVRRTRISDKIVGDVDQPQPVSRSGLQLERIGLRIAVNEQEIAERIVLTNAENDCPVMLGIVLLSRLEDDQRSIDSIQNLRRVMPMCVIDESPGARRSHAGVNDVPGGMAGDSFSFVPVQPETPS